MKTYLAMAALLASGAAFAQTEETTTTTTTTITTAKPATSQVVQPGNASPELDARGIPVISDPAVAPPGFNNPPGMGGPLADASSPPAPQPATQSYPPCSRTVTDRCVQTYERGRSR